MLIAARAYSNYGFGLALPTERTEAILAGMVAAFSRDGELLNLGGSLLRADVGPFCCLQPWR